VIFGVLGNEQLIKNHNLQLSINIGYLLSSHLGREGELLKTSSSDQSMKDDDHDQKEFE